MLENNVEARNPTNFLSNLHMNCSVKRNWVLAWSLQAILDLHISCCMIMTLFTTDVKMKMVFGSKDGSTQIPGQKC